MGFSVSGATAVIFVSLLFGFGMFYGSVSNGVERVAGAREEASEAALDRQNSAIGISELAYNGTTNTLDIAVRNEGATALSVTSADLLVDNDFRSQSSMNQVAVDGDTGTDLWLPGEVLVIELETSPAPNRVTIATENGLVESGAL
jgi:archaeal flagellar protein FlaF